MQIAENTPRVLATVAGQTVQVPQPFAEGYTLSANEAAAMNQLLTENLRNNIASRAKKAKEDGKEFNLQTELDSYAHNYQFGARSVGFRATDPIERIMRQLSKKQVEAAIKAKGIKLKTVSDDQMESLVSQYIDAHGDKLRKIAEDQIASEAALAAAVLGDGATT